MARIKPQALLQQSKKKKAPSKISATTFMFCGLIVVLALFFLYSTYTHRSIRFVDGAYLRFFLHLNYSRFVRFVGFLW
ncbi:unnamed protein product [Linum tenue]|uniref:Cell division protein FtsK n=1 Tax=Linum tenue TaxID=586396 RepID=A0AAV0JA77_9ROSI|nr:unnamed protein product [Linum tenue]